MGSLSSSPKVPPSQPQIVYMPAPRQSETTSGQSGSLGQGSAEGDTDRQERAAQKREQSLLHRNRGRFGTLSRGFTGFLAESRQESRKTLLGQ